MRNALAYSGLMGIIILTVSCTSSQPIAPQHHNTPAIPSEDRISRAPTGTITMDLSDSGHDSDLNLLLTLSNSTAESIELPLGTDDCYRDTFWFYIKTEMGWHPMMTALSAWCHYSSPGELIPSGLEKELNLSMIAGIHQDLDYSKPASYMLRIKYTDPAGQEFSLYTDEFRLGTPVTIDKFGITVENAASNTLAWRIANHANQSVWLAPLCSSSRLGSGAVDEEGSTLQHLTDAGSWSSLQVACKLTPTVIEIPEGATLIIDGSQWLEDAGLSLQPGQYRWDLMFFLRAYPVPQLDAVDEGLHVFSKIFSIQN